MDKLEGITSALSQVTMYDLKSYYNQAKNIVLNVSEMEAKVREATNDDPWGASSTLMTEIAQGTFNFQQFNEIMPCIYSRFMEKEASQWRQIYKALQLLEYIIKHGSERVVDDARSHLSTIKMLRNFHHIDENGKDQGINVRNRSKELAELLSDLDRIRQERRKAKGNRTKYTGTGSDGLSFASATGSRYGGFGSEEVGASSGYGGGYDRDYSSGGGGGSGGGRSGGFSDESGRKGYEEYDAGEDDVSSPTTNHRRSESLSRANIGSVNLPRKVTQAASSKTSSGLRSAATPPPQAKKPANVIDLLGFGDEEAESMPPPPPPSTTKVAPVASLDDDFDDFQSATPTASASTALPSVKTAVGSANVFDFLGSSASPATSSPIQAAPLRAASASAFGMGAAASAQPQQTQSAFGSFGAPMAAVPMGGMGAPMSPMSSAPNASRPNYFGSGSGSLLPTQSSKPPTPYATKPGPPASGGAGAFDDLWSMGLGKPASSTKAGSSASSGPAKSIKDLEREKQQAAIWGSQQRPAMGGSGGFGGTASTSSGADDLLL